jgi:hypothetical protein
MSASPLDFGVECIGVIAIEAELRLDSKCQENKDKDGLMEILEAEDCCGHLEAAAKVASFYIKLVRKTGRDEHRVHSRPNNPHLVGSKLTS